ncbi:uncharacterized protein LOC120340436 [Styela clava]
MKRFIHFLVWLCVGPAFCSAGGPPRRDKAPPPPPPECQLKRPPLNNPDPCPMHVYWEHRCLPPKPCLFTIKKGIVREKGVKHYVKLSLPVTHLSRECKKYGKICSPGKKYCTCQHKGEWVKIKAWVLWKKNNFHISALKKVEALVPGGCMCARRNIVSFVP